MPTKFPASDEFIAWAQSLSGFLTKLKCDYGCMSELVERSDWDEGKTRYARALIQGLHKNLSEVNEELNSHVAEKFGENA